MPLHCSCPDPDGPDWTEIEPPAADDAYITFAGRRATRCWSCDDRIRPGDTCTEFQRLRAPTDFECDRLNWREDEGVPLAPRHICERCGDIYWSLTELGFCVFPNENQLDMLNDYHDFVADARARRQSPQPETAA